jgi:hypothetical protein
MMYIYKNTRTHYDKFDAGSHSGGYEELYLPEITSQETELIILRDNSKRSVMKMCY